MVSKYPTISQNIPLLSSIFTNFDYVMSPVFVLFSWYFLQFSQETKITFSLFPSHYFHNLFGTPFFFPRLFSICFAIEVNLELSFLFFWHVISDLLLKFMRHKWELPDQGLSSEKYVTSTERHFSTCYFKIFLNLNLCFILFFLN